MGWNSGLIVAKSPGLTLGTSLPGFPLLSLSGQYLHPSKDSSLSRRLILSFHPGVFQFSISRGFHEEYMTSGSIGIRLSNQKRFEIQHSFSQSTGQKQIAFHSQIGYPIGFGVSVFQNTLDGIKSYEGRVSLEYTWDHFSAYSGSHLSPEKEISKSEVLSSLTYFNQPDQRPYLTRTPHPDTGKKDRRNYQWKKPLYRKFFHRLTPKKKYIKPFPGFVLAELLRKKIPIREALLLVRVGKDREKYEALLKTLPKETQKRCRSLELSKQPRRKK
ncbi:MAG: hypothetical protein H7A24_06050 [Leptospiraceae bacterium]|nr:hypothetical protein [Leptospiraceae bacterium]